MRRAGGVIAALAAIALAFSFVGAGFVACVLPPVTHALSQAFSDDATSPFDRDQLTYVAEATRDYSFGSHDLLALCQVIYDVDVAYADDEGLSAVDMAQLGFPRVDEVSDRSNLEQLQAAFDGASEAYCLSSQSISHLDDCNAIARVAYPAVAAAMALAAVGIVILGMRGCRTGLCADLLGAGLAVVVAFVVLGTWATLDFDGFFAAFHSVLFSQGNWMFSYDSLLICALPTEFWAGMGAVWLFVALALSVASIVVSRRLHAQREAAR